MYFIYKQGKMVAEDKQEKERVDARNALEEYVYDLRGKLSEEDQLATFVSEADKDELCRTLNETEDWLYGAGEDCQREVYADGLALLKVYYFIRHADNSVIHILIIYILFMPILPNALFSLLVKRGTNKRKKIRI